MKSMRTWRLLAVLLWGLSWSSSRFKQLDSSRFFFGYFFVDVCIFVFFFFFESNAMLEFRIHCAVFSFLYFIVSFSIIHFLFYYAYSIYWQYKKGVFVNFLGMSRALTFFINRITNQRFGRKRSRFDNTFKGNGVPVKSKQFQESVTCILDWTYIRQ